MGHKIYFIHYRFILLLVISFTFSCSSSKIISIGQSQQGSLYKNTDVDSDYLKTDTENKDFDGDGIVNSEDKCISVPETFNFYMDGDGCPDNFKYSDENLEIKYIQIFNPINNLSSNITDIIEMKFLNIFNLYPQTYWVIDVRSSSNHRKKAEAIKTYIDKKINTSKRTRIMYSHDEFDEVYLLIDNDKAREIATTK